MKIKIDNVPAETKAHETPNGWRCEVTWMLQWGRGGSVLGRGCDAQSAEADFLLRAKEDDLNIT
tara:strand:+ start:277 stop:468 length:192 start_codon:yes stop_codon:yes gene_type:complete